jgi:hypothetical protein
VRKLTLTAFRDDSPTLETIQGLGINIALSPYFFPERLDCEYDPQQGSLIIHFRYMDREDPDVLTQTPDPRVLIREAKHTRRLLEVHVPVDQHDIGGVQLQVTDQVQSAIEQAARQHRDPRSGASYALAREAIIENKGSIQELVGATAVRSSCPGDPKDFTYNPATDTWAAK